MLGLYVDGLVPRSVSVSRELFSLKYPLVLLDFFFRRNRRKIKRAASNAPSAIPGTKPAAKDLPLKSEPDLSLSGSSPATAPPAAGGGVLSSSSSGEGVALAVVAVVELDDEADAGSATQELSLHLYPIGQQLSPQVSSSKVGSECSWLEGTSVAFCIDRLHDTVPMELQSPPAGQHMLAVTEASVCRARHVLPFGQQKSDGKSPPHWLRLELPPQVDSCRGARRLLSKSGSKSSGIQMTRAAAGRRRHERASARSAVAVVVGIMKNYSRGQLEERKADREMGIL